MKSDGDRDRKSFEELKQMHTSRPTEDAELVLDPDELRTACFNPVRGADIVVDLLLADGASH